MDIRSATEAKPCPRSQAFEVILDERSHRDNNAEWSLVCGFVRDDREGDIPLPHYSIQYRLEGVLFDNLVDTFAPGTSAGIEELHGCMPVDDFAEAKARETEGYEFMKCVLVNMEGHVIWLRGDPGEWKWEGGN